MICNFEATPQPHDRMKAYIGKLLNLMNVQYVLEKSTVERLGSCSLVTITIQDPEVWPPMKTNFSTEEMERSVCFFMQE